MCDFVASSQAFVAKAVIACDHWCPYILRHRALLCVLLTHVWKPGLICCCGQLQIRDGFSGVTILDQTDSFQPGTIIGKSNSVVLFLRSDVNLVLEDWNITWSGIPTQ